MKVDAAVAYIPTSLPAPAKFRRRLDFPKIESPDFQKGARLLKSQYIRLFRAEGEEGQGIDGDQRFLRRQSAFDSSIFLENHVSLHREAGLL